jgi:hypothetical protein
VVDRNEGVSLPLVVMRKETGEMDGRSKTGSWKRWCLVSTVRDCFGRRVSVLVRLHVEKNENRSWVILIQLNREKCALLSSAWLPIAVPIIGAKIGSSLTRLGIGGVILLLVFAWLVLFYHSTWSLAMDLGWSNASDGCVYRVCTCLTCFDVHAAISVHVRVGLVGSRG